MWKAIAIALCSAGTGFGAGWFAHTPEPPQNDFEIVRAGSNQSLTIKINKRTGETWRFNSEKNDWKRAY